MSTKIDEEGIDKQITNKYDAPIKTMEELKQWLVELHDTDNRKRDFSKMRSDMVAYVLLNKLLLGSLIPEYVLTFGGGQQVKWDKEHPNGVKVK